jgi:hypothetical protein
MITIDGVSYETPSLSEAITSQAHTIATLATTAISSQAPHAVTWRRMHGLPSADHPKAMYVLLITPTGEAVALGSWPFGQPVTLARGEVHRLYHNLPEEPEYSPVEPPLKQARIENKENGFWPAPAMHSPDVIMENVDRLSFYTKLERIYDGCQRNPKMMTGNEFITYIVPPGDFQDYFLPIWANTVRNLTQSEHLEAALYHLARVDVIPAEMQQRLGAHLAKVQRR